MRLHLKTTPNSEIVPFEYQQKLVGTFHKWLGIDNFEHGNVSLYSFSWLQNGMKKSKGFDFPNGAHWFFSLFQEDRAKYMLRNILKDPEMFMGMTVHDVVVEKDPDLSHREFFYVGSPILIKRNVEGTHNQKYFYYDNVESSELMKQSLVHKMQIAGIEEDDSLDIRFNLDYSNRKKKLISYNGIYYKGSLCPIMMKGKPFTKEFAWNVGIGNSTGIGFGSIY